MTRRRSRSENSMPTENIRRMTPISANSSKVCRSETAGPGVKRADQDAAQHVAEDQRLAREPRERAAHHRGHEHVGEIAEEDRLADHAQVSHPRAVRPSLERRLPAGRRSRHDRATQSARAPRAGEDQAARGAPRAGGGRSRARAQHRRPGVGSPAFGSPTSRRRWPRHVARAQVGLKDSVNRLSRSAPQRASRREAARRSPGAREREGVARSAGPERSATPSRRSAGRSRCSRVASRPASGPAARRTGAGAASRISAWSPAG